MHKELKNFFILLSLISVVFLAGCIGQPTGIVVVKNGLIIQSFSPDFQEVRSGESITLSLMVENVGEADATDVSAQLFGLNFGPNDWSTPSENPKKVSIIRKADPSLNLPGESHEFNWNLASPANLRVDNVYTADARVYYEYSTAAASMLKFMTYDYLKSLPTDQFESMKELSGVTQTTVSGAPVSISMTVGNRPLIVYSDGDTFSLQIIISNVGSGNPFDASAQYPGYPTSDAILKGEELYEVGVSISTDLDLDCSSALGSAKSGEIKLTRGKSKTMFCTITVDETSDIQNVRDYSVSVDLSYGYFVDSSTTIKVLKSEAPGTTTTTQPGEEECPGGCPPGYSCVDGACVLS